MAYSPTLQQVLQRILFCVASCDSDLKMFHCDITQAYMQAGKNIIRKIFFRPPPSIHLGWDKLLQIVQVLYGLAESGLFWFETYHSYQTEKISIIPAIHDIYLLFSPSLFSSLSVQRVTCLQIKNTTNIRTKAFLELEEKMGRYLKRKLIFKLEKGGTLEFNGASIQLNNGVYSISQIFDSNRLQKTPTDTNINKPAFISHHSRRVSIALSLSWPDLTAGFAISFSFRTQQKTISSS